MREEGPLVSDLYERRLISQTVAQSTRTVVTVLTGKPVVGVVAGIALSRSLDWIQRNARTLPAKIYEDCRRQTSAPQCDCE